MFSSYFRAKNINLVVNFWIFLNMIFIFKLSYTLCKKFFFLLCLNLKYGLLIKEQTSRRYYRINFIFLLNFLKTNTKTSKIVLSSLLRLKAQLVKIYYILFTPILVILWFLKRFIHFHLCTWSTWHMVRGEATWGAGGGPTLLVENAIFWIFSFGPPY